MMTMSNFFTEDLTCEKAQETLKFLLRHKEEFYAFEEHKNTYEKQLVLENLWRHNLADDLCWEELEDCVNGHKPECFFERLSVDYIDSLCYVYAFIHKEAHFTRKDVLKLKWTSRLNYYFFEDGGSIYGFASDELTDSIYLCDYTINGDEMCIIETLSHNYMCTCGTRKNYNEVLKVCKGNTDSFKRGVATGIYSWETLKSHTNILSILPFA